MLMLLERIGIPRVEWGRDQKRTGLGMPLSDSVIYCTQKIYLRQGERKFWLHLNHLCISHSCQHKLLCNEPQSSPSVSDTKTRRGELARRCSGDVGLHSQKDTTCSPLQNVRLECPHNARPAPDPTPTDSSRKLGPHPQSRRQLSGMQPAAIWNGLSG